MPIVTVDMWEGRTKEQKSKLVSSVTQAVSESAGCDKDKVAVVIRESKKENWGIAGKLASEL
jgi:4-oxalocrotonate tautomerase